MVTSDPICSLLLLIADQWFRYSDEQKIKLFLFGSSVLTNNEIVEIFSQVQNSALFKGILLLFFFFSRHYNYCATAIKNTPFLFSSDFESTYPK